MGRVARWQKISIWISGVVVLALVSGSVAAVWTVRRSFPQTEGTIQLVGLGSDVTVLRDSSGIPQIYADTSADLFFAQGYVQAQDRFFQMDFRRHLTAGQLSELFGHEVLEADMFVRTLGWRRVAEQELALLSTDTRGYLESFSQGVNAYLGDHDGAEISLEYGLLGLTGLDYTPAEWTPADSLAWLKAMAWNLGSNLDDEIDRSLQSTQLSRAEIDTLWPDYPYPRHEPIVTQGAVVDGVYEQDATRPGTRLPSRPPLLLRAETALRRAEAAEAGVSELLGSGGGIGSNAWAVSGDRTATGAPMLANDPHLAASVPGTWYQMGLHCNHVDRECPFDVTGFTFAGFPGVAIGHNADVAWGFSNLYADVQDLYLEQVTDDDTYLYNGRQRPLRVREETFEVEGEDEPVRIQVRESRHGPLISDVDEKLAEVGDVAPFPAEDAQAEEGGAGAGGDGTYAVALRWTALLPGRTADALFGFNAAHNWNDFRDAARYLEAPSQNLVYADTAGHIGYQAPGLIPIRRTGHGDWPVPGWDPAYEWDDDFIPFDALPSVLDPDDGFVIAANQAVADTDYPYYLGSSVDYGYRSDRIRKLLTGDDALTVEDMASIQLDNYSALAEHLTPRLLDVQLPSNYYRYGQHAFANWNFHFDADSAAAAYFSQVWRFLLDFTFADQLPHDALPAGDSRWWTVMERLFDDPRNVFWDDLSTSDVQETRDDIVRLSMMTARDEMTKVMSRRVGDWEWGRLHTLTLRHEALGQPGSPVSFLFNRGDVELGGGPSIVNATSYDLGESFEVAAVPSMRMVVSLDDLDQATWINLTGASGHAYAHNYTDQTELWAEGEQLPWLFGRDEVEAAADNELTLSPAG
ncbi:MAG: penicillin acylase family protein [Nocardioidaceae bacterium]